MWGEVMSMMIRLIWRGRRQWGAREEDSQRVQRGHLMRRVCSLLWLSGWAGVSYIQMQMSWKCTCVNPGSLDTLQETLEYNRLSRVLTTRKCPTDLTRHIPLCHGAGSGENFGPGWVSHAQALGLTPTGYSLLDTLHSPWWFCLWVYMWST